MSAERMKWVRIGALIALFVGSAIAVKLTGVSEDLTRESIQSMMQGAGWWGLLLFLGVFAVGELLHVPGLVFVAAAIVAYGQALGGLAGYLGALVSVSVSFVVVRLVGGQPLADVKRPILRRWLDRLDQNPVRAVAVLRLILWMAPPLNYALAMSKLRFREYILGSAIGLVLPIAIVTALFEWFLAWL